jgi:transposase
MTATGSPTIVPLEYDIFVGMDVDKKSVAVTTYDHNEKVSFFKTSNQSEKIINYMQKHFPDKKVVMAYEVGPTGYGLYDRLSEAGYNCLVVSASSVPTPSRSRVKTNKLDSKYIGKALRGGELQGVRVPSTKYRYLRNLIHQDLIIGQQISKYKCRIKALFLLEGIAYPNKKNQDHWSNNTIKRLEKMELEAPIRFSLDILLENLRHSRQQRLRVKKEIRRYCRNDQELADSIQYLMSIPGIGWTISSHLVARIGDWRRLKNVRELAGFLGLTPCEHSTGDDVKKGNITRSGDSRLRNMLIEGAWSAVAHDPEMKEFYLRIYNRHPKDRAARKAIVAVARKMTTRIFRVLKDRRLYIPAEKYTIHHRPSNRKRRLPAPKDASTLCRTRKYVLQRDKTFSPVFAGSSVR